jgi:hypothetical protein
MTFPIDTGTSSAGTEEWLEATRHMFILPSLDASQVYTLDVDGSEEGGAPGRHMRETLEALRRLVG